LSGKKPKENKVSICVPPTPDGAIRADKEKETTTNLFQRLSQSPRKNMTAKGKEQNNGMIG
jgi:hypothetical protein